MTDLSKESLGREIDVEFFSDVGKEVLSLVEEALLADATAHDNVLTVEQIQDVIGALAHAPNLMADILKTLARPNVKIKYKRDPFTRILVDSFSHLFPNDDGFGLAQGALSRRVLPGFFVAIRLMIGGGPYDKFQTECQELIARISEERPTLSDFALWDAFYAHPEAKKMSMLVYTRVALYFSLYDKRKAWFTRMVNSKLKVVKGDNTSPEEIEWSFGDEHFLRLFSTLYLDKKTRSRIKEGYRKLLSKEFDPGAVKKVETMCAALVKDIAECPSIKK